MTKSSRRVNFLPDAKKDLRGIGRYSVREWGRARTRSYVADIRKACKMLAIYPYLGSACDDIDDIVEDCREYGVGRHIIYYLPTERTIEVVRILHVRMDARRHLQDL